MINSFSKFLVEEEKTAYFTMGRFNPPTIGHGMLLDQIAENAGKSTYKVFVSQSNDPKKNPLQYKEKVKFIRKMFPKHARSVVMDSTIKTPIDAAVKLFNEGYKKIVVLGDADRSREYSALFERYNGKEARHGFYHFENMKFVSVGERNDNAKGIEGVSATKQRQYALNEDFTSFAQNLPKNVSNKDAKDLFNAVRKGMGLSERKEFKNHVQLEPVSEIREAYVNDGLFQEGDEVVMHKNEIVGKIKHLGANYVIVESKGETWRCWLNDVSKVDPNTQNYDTYDIPNDDFDGIIRESLTEAKTPYEWGTPEATKKAKSMTPGETKESLWANIRAKRARGERMRKKGEKGAPTQDQIKRAQGEAVSPAQQAAIAISKKERGEKPMKEYGGPPISRKEYLKQKPMQEKTPQDPDIKDREGTQPKRYHSGLKKSTKVARDAHFKKHGKKADNDPSAYQPAPGDKTAKTKPSKYTKAVRDMMGEDAVSQARDRIAREKEAERKSDAKMKRRHDSILDRARRARMLRRNRGISDD